MNSVAAHYGYEIEFRQKMTLKCECECDPAPNELSCSREQNHGTKSLTFDLPENLAPESDYWFRLKW
jgi:hypothetical protein